MRICFLILLSLLVFSVGNCFAVEPKMPGKKDRCPVCGMFVAPYADWVATIMYKDHSQLFFDGPKDLFRYYYSLPSKEDSHRRDDIEAIYLTEYYSTRLMLVEQLYLVNGSHVHGPMGHEIIPIDGEDAAKTFAKDHNGKKIITIEQLSPELLQSE